MMVVAGEGYGTMRFGGEGITPWEHVDRMREGQDEHDEDDNGGDERDGTSERAERNANDERGGGGAGREDDDEWRCATTKTQAGAINLLSFRTDKAPTAAERKINTGTVEVTIRPEAASAG